MEKRREISPVLERHIIRMEIIYNNGVRTETVWSPDNADSERSSLNQELVSRKTKTPEGKEITLTINQVIRKRLNEAGIKNVRKNQNTALEIILTGSPEKMNSLSEKELKKWVQDSMDWAGKQWGKDNIVSAVLHRDEKTPHIHIILVPLVTGQSRRTASKEKKLAQQGITKKNYNVDNKRLRLSANEVYTKPRLYGYHTSYAKDVGVKYGLQRGIVAEAGSKRKHLTSEDYNRQLERERREKQELIDTLTSEYSEKEKNLEKINADIEIARDAFNLAEKNRSKAEARKIQADNDAATKEAQVKELETKSSSLSGEIESKENEFSELENRIKEEEDASWAVKNMLEKHIADCKAKYKNIETAIENRQEEIRSLKSAGIAQLIKDIPNLIKKDIQKIVEKSWNGELISCEEKEYQTNGQTEKFIEIKMKNAGKEYEFMVWERNGRIFKDGKWYKWEKTKEDAYMPELASYFTQELTEEAKEFVKSFYKVEPTKTEKNKNKNISKNKERGI